jgi:hypothetical protein
MHYKPKEGYMADDTTHKTTEDMRDESSGLQDSEELQRAMSESDTTGE